MSVEQKTNAYTNPRRRTMAPGLQSSDKKNENDSWEKNGVSSHFDEDLIYQETCIAPQWLRDRAT
jgi:hypothetical protein